MDSGIEVADEVYASLRRIVDSRQLEVTLKGAVVMLESGSDGAFKFKSTDGRYDILIIVERTAIKGISMSELIKDEVHDGRCDNHGNDSPTRS